MKASTVAAAADTHRRRASLLVATALLLVAAGCEDKPTRAPEAATGGPRGAARLSSPKSEAGSATDGARASLRRHELTDDEFLMFLPRTILLARKPPPGVSSTPDVEAAEAKGGALRYGSIPVAGAQGGAGRAEDGPTVAAARSDAASVPFALLFMPAPPEDDAPWHWKLYIDRDRDGELADEEPFSMRPKELKENAKEKISEKIKSRLRGNLAARFPAVEVVLPGGRLHAYSIMAIAYRGTGQGGTGSLRTAFVRSAVGLVARARVFGKQTDVRIYDANVNGRFGDVQLGPAGSADSVWIDFDSNGRADRDKGELKPMARRIYHDGRAVTLAVLDGARTLLVEEVEVKLGAVRRAGREPKDAAEEALALQLFSSEYGLLGLGADRVPAGEHRLLGYQLAGEGADGKKWALAGAWLAPFAPRVTVSSSGAPAEVAFGPPIEARPWFAFDGGRMLARIALRGSGGEDVRVWCEEKRAAFEGYRVLTRGGAELGSGKVVPYRPMPGLYAAVWEPPAGLEEGTDLTFELGPTFEPFAEGFKGRLAFELGRATPLRLVVSSVEKGSQAERAGVRAGDVILRYDGSTIDNEFVMNRALMGAAGKDSVELVVLRGLAEERFVLKPGRIGVQVAFAMPKRKEP